MSSSNELLHQYSRTPSSAGDPGFSVIFAFDYYDGPEHGVALYPSGTAVRFTSLGDSKSRLFRAFELIPIDGNWWPQIKALQNLEGSPPPARVVLPATASSALTELENRVLQANVIGQFVGVGSPDFERMSVCPVTDDQLEGLRKLGCSPAGFELAHRLVKSWKSEG